MSAYDLIRSEKSEVGLALIRLFIEHAIRVHFLFLFTLFAMAEFFYNIYNASILPT